MRSNKNQTNQIVIYRRRMGFTQEHVAHLMGFQSATMLSRYEHGRSLPPLPRALALGAILRVPVEFLFPALYEGLRKAIRTAEEQFSGPIQQRLVFEK